MQASTVPAMVSPAATAARESTLGGSAVDQSSTAADTFDFSYFLVMALGLGGLFWIRRQSQSL